MLTEVVRSSTCQESGVCHPSWAETWTMDLARLTSLPTSRYNDLTRSQRSRPCSLSISILVRRCSRCDMLLLQNASWSIHDLLSHRSVGCWCWCKYRVLNDLDPVIDDLFSSGQILRKSSSISFRYIWWHTAIAPPSSTAVEFHVVQNTSKELLEQQWDLTLQGWDHKSA